MFLAAFVAAVAKPRWMRFGLLLLGALFLVRSDWGNSADFAKQFVGGVVLLMVAVWGVRRVVRFNVLGAVLLVMCMGLLGAAAELVGQADGFYKLNGYGLLGVLVVLLAWPLVVWKMRGANMAGQV